MRKTFWNTKIPTILGIILIITGLFITQKLVQNGTITIGRASPSQDPKEVRISNITDSSFTLSFKTEEKTIGSINLGTNKNLGQLVNDDRDQNDSTSHKLHYFTIKNLQPKTTYYFAIISGSETYTNSSNPFEITTIVKSQKEGNVISGKVVSSEGTPPQEAIVYLKISNSQTNSQLIKADGSFTISGDESSNASSLELLIMSDSQFSKALLSPNIKGIIPTIAMGKSYDFTTSSKTAEQEEINASDSASLGFSSLSSQVVSSAPQIITPKKDEKFSDQKPLFKGVASPGSSITVTIHSDETITTQITADKNGQWSFRPSLSLSPGTHTVSISFKDTSGLMRTITQSFIVYAEGSSFTEPSVSPVQGVTPTPSPSIKPTILPTATPKLSPTPTIVPLVTPTPSAIPTLIPTPTSQPTPTPVLVTRSKISPPGNSSLVSIGISSFFIIVAGVGLFFLTLGGSSL